MNKIMERVISGVIVAWIVVIGCLYMFSHMMGTIADKL